MLSDAMRNRSLPRGAFIAAGVMVGAALCAAVVGRITGPVATVSLTPAIEARDLRFADREDGGVAVLDARDGGTIAIAPPGTNGFLRATLRGLARERLHQSFSDGTPFRLTHWQDGRLTLDDPDTGRRVELVAFGITNFEVFARLLAAPSVRFPGVPSLVLSPPGTAPASPTGAGR